MIGTALFFHYCLRSWFPRRSPALQVGRNERRFWPIKLPPPPALDAIPDMTGQGFGFGNIVAFSVGENKQSPVAGDVIILLESCSMGMTVRRDRRVRATGMAFSQRKIYGPQSDDIYIVPTDDGRHVTLATLRRWEGVPRTWAYVT